jgi:hypothetical protein
MPKAKNITLAVLIGAVIYVASFYLLMVPGLPAYDSQDRPAFVNCPRFSESVRVPGPLHLASGRANWLNYVYYPFEFVYARRANKPAAGKARMARLLAFGGYWPGLPEPGRWAT